MNEVLRIQKFLSSIQLYMVADPFEVRKRSILTLKCMAESFVVQIANQKMSMKSLKSIIRTRSFRAPDPKNMNSDSGPFPVS